LYTAATGPTFRLFPCFDPFTRWRQGLNDATVRYHIAPALINDRAEFAAHAIKVSNLSFNFGQALARNRVNARTGSALLVRQAQKFAHLLNGKSQIARTPDEAQSSQMLKAVDAVVPAPAQNRRYSTVDQCLGKRLGHSNTSLRLVLSLFVAAPSIAALASRCRQTSRQEYEARTARLQCLDQRACLSRQNAAHFVLPQPPLINGKA